MPSLKSLGCALWLAVGLCVGEAAPVVAAGLEGDAAELHRRPLEQLADQLLEQGYVARDERVWWSTEAATPDQEDQLRRSMLVRALLERGVIFVSKESDAQVRLEAVPLRAPDERIYAPELLQGRPGPGFTLTHRLVVRAVELSTGKVRRADVLVVQDQPFARKPVARSGIETDGARSETARQLQEVQGFGVAVSWLSGSGFSYRRWMPSGRGYQVSAFPYVNGSETFFNVGGQIMQSFFEATGGRAYGLLAAGTAFGSVVEREPERLLWNLSVGGGADLRLTSNLVLSAQLGYSLSAGNRIGPGAGVGAYVEF